MTTADFTQPCVSGDPLGAARLTLLATVTEVPGAEVRNGTADAFPRTDLLESPPTNTWQFGLKFGADRSNRELSERRSNPV